MRAPNIRLKNTAERAGDNRFDWTVFIETDAKTLATIRAVEYTLPPTVSKPVRTVTTGREKGFPLSSNTFGGEFTVYAKVFFTNGATTNLKYRLEFYPSYRKVEQNVPTKEAKPAPAPPQQSINLDTASLTTQNTSNNLGVGKWEWSIFVVASDAVLRQIQYVEYTLHPTFPDPIQKVTQRGLDSGKGFYLKATGWGTFEVAVKVVFTNGKTRLLKHQLKFG